MATTARFTFRLQAADSTVMILALLLGVTIAAGDPAPGAPAGADSTGTRWALVLSGGAARGLAHIGVLRALEERRLRPDLVAGTSMGAIVGALYSCGYSSAEIERVVRRVDWLRLLFPRTDAFAWRGHAAPGPLLQLGIGVRGVRLPSAPLDDAELDWLLSDLLIGGSAASASFDRLPVPFRAVAADVATLQPVVLDSGSIARAVRASMSIPLVFAPVSHRGRLLVDGGMADNLPIAAAKRWGAARVVAVDVSEDLGSPGASSSGPAVAWYLARLMLQRHPGSAPAPGDLLVRLRMPGIGSADYAARDTLIALGYRGALAALGGWADSAGLRRPAAVPDPPPLPPLAARVEWDGLRTLPLEKAHAALGRLPRGSFRPQQLRPALARLYRSSLFESAWPALDPRGDSTVLRLEVREKLRQELALSVAWGSDERERLWARLALRAPLLPPVALLEVAGARRRYGRDAHVNLEPHALGRGGSGPFLRAGYRETETRIFERGRLAALPRTIRRELFAGAQLELPSGQIGQFALGVAALGEHGRDRQGALLVFRAEAPGATHRLYEAEWLAGPGGYSRFGAWLDISRRCGAYTLRPGIRAAAVDGDAPVDALPALGGPDALSGLRWDEWRGRRAAAVELRVLYPLGAALSLSAAAQIAVVDRANSARELEGHLQPAAGIGAAIATPFGPVRVDLGLAPGGRGRADVMLGERF